MILFENVTAEYDKFDLNGVVKLVTSFVSEDLSNWYIRRNRNRFWSSQLDNSKKAVYITTYEVLVGLCQMCAPVIPFITEEIYTKLTKEESVHLSDFPKYDEKLINEKIENRMDLVRDLISIGRNAREEAKIKVRQPLSEVLIDGKNETLISDLVSLIEEELNVKKVVFANDVNDYMNFMVKPNFKVAGPIFGQKIKMYSDSLMNLKPEEITKLKNGENIVIKVDNEEFDISKDMVDIRISAKEGFDVAMENNNFIILNTNLTDELILEGVARELISKVQNLRKNSGFEITDRIIINYNGDELFEEMLSKHLDYIKKETLANDIIYKENIDESYDLNGHEVYIEVKKD